VHDASDNEGPGFLEMLGEIADVTMGLSIILLPLLTIAIPGVLLLLVLPAVLLAAVAAAPVVIAAALLGPPYLLVRRLRRRQRSKTPPVDSPTATRRVRVGTRGYVG
jgi:Flp pilus assembly protein TadB